MIKKILITLLLTMSISNVSAEIDWGIDGVTMLSEDLGYNKTGFGIQLDAHGKHGQWGWDFQGTAFKHSKWLAHGERYQAILVGRRYVENFFLEAGAEWGGYTSRFPDDVVWEKYGYAPVAGIGMEHKEMEFTVRYLFPDTTPNNTSIIIAGAEIALSDVYMLGASFEYWSFDFRNERLNGSQLNIEFGYRF